MKNHPSFLIMLLLLSSCSLAPPEERVASWDDWDLCHRLAGYAYTGNSKWLWYSSEEISNRELQNSLRCKSIYDSRMGSLVRKNEKADISISFGQAINNKSSFEEVISK